MTQFRPPTPPPEPELENYPLPSSQVPGPSNDSEQELRHPSPQIDNLQREGPPASSSSIEMNDLLNDEFRSGDFEGGLGGLKPPPGSDEEDPPPGPDGDHPGSDNNNDNTPPAGDDEEEPDLIITREDMRITLEFIGMLENTVLESQFSPSELETLRNPQRLSTSLLHDPALLHSVSSYVANLNASQEIYKKNRLNYLRRHPGEEFLTYGRVQNMVSKFSGVVTWQNDMCIDSCAAFTGPFTHLEECPRCHEPRYDPIRLQKSNGKTKVPQKSFTAFPLGPQLQSRWKSAPMAEKMHYRRSKTEDLLREREAGEGDGYDDILGGSAYLDAVGNGQIKDTDTVIMLSADGAQLLRHKRSDCWIYIWIILDLAPNERYKVRNIIPGGVVPGPGKPKNTDWFLSLVSPMLLPYKRKDCGSGMAIEERNFAVSSSSSWFSRTLLQWPNSAALLATTGEGAVGYSARSSGATNQAVLIIIPPYYDQKIWIPTTLVTATLTFAASTQQILNNIDENSTSFSPHQLTLNTTSGDSRPGSRRPASSMGSPAFLIYPPVSPVILCTSLLST